MFSWNSSPGKNIINNCLIIEKKINRKIVIDKVDYSADFKF